MHNTVWQAKRAVRRRKTRIPAAENAVFPGRKGRAWTGASL